MKQLITQMYLDAKWTLDKMMRSKMTLYERIKFEKALVSLENMKRVIDASEIQPKS